MGLNNIDNTRASTLIVSQDGTGNYNGSTHVAIQAAIDFLEANGGGQLIIKEGTYLIGATLTIAANDIHITGMGSATELKADNAFTSGQMFTCDGYDRIIIENIQVNGRADEDTRGDWNLECMEFKNMEYLVLRNITNPHGFYSNNFEIWTSKYCVIDNVEGNGSSGDNILLTNTCEYCIICNCTSHDTADVDNFNNAIGIYKSATHCIAYGNKCYTCEGYGINVEDPDSGSSPCTYNIVIGNQVKDCYSGISLIGANTEHNLIADNIVKNVISKGTQIVGNYNVVINNLFETQDSASTAAFIEMNGEFCIVAQNRILATDNDAIFANNSDNCIIANNFIETTTIGSGIRTYNCDLLTITGNTIKDVTLYGMRVENITNSTISNNTITGSGGHGIRASGTGLGLSITGNVILLNTDNGIILDGDGVGFVSIIGNIIRLNGESGIYLNSADDIIISANIIYDNNTDAGTNYGIRVYNSSNNIITGNRVSTAHSKGFSSSGTSDYNIITSNNFIGNDAVITVGGGNSVNANNLDTT